MQEDASLLESYGQGISSLLRVGVVSPPVRENLLNELTIQSSEIESLLNSFRPTPILDVREIEYTGFVYNLGVANDHSYLVDGLIVHNCGCPVVAWDSDPFKDNHPYKYARAFDTHDLADKIMQAYGALLDDPVKVHAECRKIAEDNFDVRKEAKDVVAILRKVSNESKK